MDSFHFGSMVTTVVCAVLPLPLSLRLLGWRLLPFNLPLSFPFERTFFMACNEIYCVVASIGVLHTIYQKCIAVPCSSHLFISFLYTYPP
jgi:hypothetical protein